MARPLPPEETALSRKTLHIVLVGLLLGLSRRALADPSAEDKALADTLYGDAGKLAQRGDYAGAKKKLEASLALDPGIGTLIRLAWCEEKLGLIASAWTHANEAEAMARRLNDKRAVEAAETSKRLAPMLSKLVLRVAPENRGEGFEVRKNGVALKAGALDAEIPLDPGEHTIEASRPGKVPWKTVVVIRPGPGATMVDVPPLHDAPAAPPPMSTPAPFWTGQRIAGVTMGGAGLVGIAVGSAFTAVMVSKNHQSMAFCPTVQTECTAQGVSLRNDAFDAAHVATGAWAAGGILAGAGLVVFLTAPSKPATPSSRAHLSAVVSPSMAGAQLAGAW